MINHRLSKDNRILLINHLAHGVPLHHDDPPEKRYEDGNILNSVLETNIISYYQYIEQRIVAGLNYIFDERNCPADDFRWIYKYRRVKQKFTLAWYPQKRLPGRLYPYH